MSPTVSKILTYYLIQSYLLRLQKFINFSEAATGYGCSFVEKLVEKKVVEKKCVFYKIYIISRKKYFYIEKKFYIENFFLLKKSFLQKKNMNENLKNIYLI